MRIQLTTDRLILRPFDISDVEALVRACNDWDIARQTASLPYPYDNAHAESWLLLMASDDAPKAHIYAITQDGDIIGCVSLMAVDEYWDLGYWLTKGCWHQGLMQEAVTALLAEADMTLTNTKITASVYADNPRSLALLNRNGFRETAPQRKEFCVARQTDVPTHILTRITEADHA